ncbi:MAG: hypothetical protein ABR529_00290 [Actinomycetota bacterium]
MALLLGGIAVFWSPRIGTTLVSVGALLVVFMIPWMAAVTLPIALFVIYGTIACGRGAQRVDQA